MRVSSRQATLPPSARLACQPAWVAHHARFRANADSCGTRLTLGSKRRATGTRIDSPSATRVHVSDARRIHQFQGVHASWATEQMGVNHIRVHFINQ